MLDRKGVFSFLAITFGITYLIEGGMIAAGFRVTEVPAIAGQYILAGVMWVPALATVITVKFITREGFAITNFRFGNWKPYVFAALVMPLIFAVVYGLTWLLGLGNPDWALKDFFGLMTSLGAPADSLPQPSTFLPVMLLASVIAGPTINGIFGFGEEFGWLLAG